MTFIEKVEKLILRGLIILPRVAIQLGTGGPARVLHSGSRYMPVDRGGVFQRTIP